MTDADNVFDKIHKLLRSLPKVHDLKHVTDRVFQRIPTLSAKIFEQIDEIPKSQRKIALINELVSKIKFFTENLDASRECGLPRKKTDYLKYIDLLVLIQRSQAKTWRVYHLTNYNKPENVEEMSLQDRGVQLRSSLKSSLSEKGYLCSIQTETDDNRLWFSISYTRKTSNKEKDKKRLLKSRFYYVVYYPEEPYLYSGGARLPPELGGAFADCTKSSNFTVIPLEGRHLESLRQLRLNRENRRRNRTEEAMSQRCDFFKRPDDVEQKEKFPLLDRVRTECLVEFKDLDEVQNREDLRGKKLKIRLECSGTDIIGGLQDMIEADMVRKKQVPRWIVNLPTSGRNLVTLVPSIRNETDPELQSLLSTASTTMRNSTRNRAR